MVQNGNWYISQSEFWPFFCKDKDSEILLSSEMTYSKEQLNQVFCKFVNVIYMELSSYCNRKCVYCPIATQPREQREMSDDIFDTIISELVEIDFRNTISISLYNEPLADERLVDKIKIIHKQLPYCYIRFNSNGDYLTRELLDELSEAGCKELQITMHFVPDEKYDDLLAKKKIESFFKRLDLDYEIKSFKAHHNFTIDLIYRNIRLLVLTNNWEEDGNSRGGIVEMLNSSERQYPCVAPFREVAIDIDGNMRRCCNMFVSSNPISNIKNSGGGIVEFFFSERMKELRRNLLLFRNERFQPCDTCNTPDYATSENPVLWNDKMKDRFGGELCLK